MAISDIIQMFANSRVDARSLSEFIFKPADFMVTRRLAPPINTLQFYLDRFDSITNDAVQAVIDALDTTAVGEGGVSAQLVVDDGRTQRHINKLISFGYANVYNMINDESISIEKSIYTNGYYAKGDGGGVKYDIVGVVEAIAKGITYWKTGNIKNHYAFSLKNNLVAVIAKLDEYALEQLGAIADGLNDCQPIFMTALSIYPSGTGYYQSSPTIHLRTGGKYYCSQRINLKRSVKIYSDGSGLPSSSTAVVIFAAGSAGFIVNRFNTLDNTKQATPTTAADASILEGFDIKSTRGTADSTGGHGIWLRARANLSKMTISGFEGNGLHIYAASNGGDGFIGNANNYSLNNLRIGGNENGVYVEGYDANAGTAVGIDSSSNRRWGIIDKSFLGNQWYGCHVASNGSQLSYAKYQNNYYQANVEATKEQLVAVTPGTDESVWLSGLQQTSFAKDWVSGMPVGSFDSGGSYATVGLNNRATFSGCYSEGGQGYVQGNAQHSIFLAGFLVETPVIGGAAWIRGEFGKIKGTGFFVEERKSALYAQTVLQAKDNIHLSFGSSTTANPSLWSLKSTTDGGFHFSYRNSAQIVALRVLGFNNAHQSEPLEVMGTHVVGSGQNSARVGAIIYASSLGVTLPTAGDYKIGDRWYTTKPVAGDFVGFVCTVSGTAGSTAVFKKFGAIQV